MIWERQDEEAVRRWGAGVVEGGPCVLRAEPGGTERTGRLNVSDEGKLKDAYPGA